MQSKAKGNEKDKRAKRGTMNGGNQTPPMMDGLC